MKLGMQYIFMQKSGRALSINWTYQKELIGAWSHLLTKSEATCQKWWPTMHNKALKQGRSKLRRLAWRYA